MSEHHPDALPSTDHSAVRAFFEQWAIYQRVVQHNYMFHREIAAAIAANSTQAAAPTPASLTILDLGCGDAAVLEPSGLHRHTRHYCGIDAAASALEFAASTLTRLQLSHILIEANYLDAVAELDQQFDLILCGFTLHHLNSADKSHCIALCADRLKPGGRLLIYDELRNDQESRDHYIERICRFVERDWQLLAPSDRDAIVEHVRKHDWPATQTLLDQIGQQHFNGAPNLLYQDPHHFYALHQFQRSQDHNETAQANSTDFTADCSSPDFPPTSVDRSGNRCSSR